MRNSRICGAGGVIDAQKNYRIVIPYRDSFCKLLRFSIARDGSVNLSSYLKDATEMPAQSFTAKPGREIETECEIATLTFSHPKEMGLVNETDIEGSDMVAQVNIRDTHPLFASITLAKWTEAQNFVPKGQILWMQMLKCNAPDLGEMVLGVYLFETNPGPWPTECGTLIKTLPET